MKCIPYGPRALLIQFADRVGDSALTRCQCFVAELERRPPAGLIEFVPAFTTILLEFDREIVPEPLGIATELLNRLEAAVEEQPSAPIKEIPVIYDGPDLAVVANTKGLTTEDVCRLHSAPLYRVYMLGFAPGFPYLGELDSRLHTPRLASPRPKIAAGSVGIGGEHTGIYTVDSPGGWHVIGRTTLKIFDPNRGPPNGSDDAMFMLKQGDCVRFVPVANG